MTRYASTQERREKFARVVARMKEKGVIWAVPATRHNEWCIVTPLRPHGWSSWSSNLEAQVKGRCIGPGWDLLDREDVPLYLADVVSHRTNFVYAHLSEFIIAGLTARLELGI